MRPYRLMVRWSAKAVLLLSACVLVYSSLAKLDDVPGLTGVIAAHGVLAGPWARTAAWGAIALEAGCGVGAIMLLALGARGWQVGIVLCVGWTVLAVYARWLAFHPPARPAPCGCGFGRTPVDDWWMIAARNWAGASCAGVAGKLGGRGGVRRAPGPDMLLA